MKEALIQFEMGDLEQARHHFDLCRQESVRALSSSESFIDRCQATRLRIMCILYLNGYFSEDRNTVKIQKLCKNALDELF
jgi:hypothetical protein